MINNNETTFTNTITFKKDINVGKEIDLFEPGGAAITITSQEAKIINGMVFFTVQFKSTATSAWQTLLKLKGTDYKPVKAEGASMLDVQAGTNTTCVIGITGAIQNITTIVASRTYYITGFYFIK